MKAKDSILKAINYAKIDLIPKLISSWLLVTAFMLAMESNPLSVDSFRDTKIVFFALAIIAIFFQLSLLQKVFPKIGVAQISIITSTAIFGMILSFKQDNFYVTLASSVIAIIAILYAFTVNKKIFLKITKFRIVIIAVIALLFAATSIAVSILRLKTYSTPNYDFGIFSNMYHHMKTGFSPITSCERDKFLSHFAVHFSPIFYVLLPIYCIFPSPATLLVSQTVILYIGIIPLYLIMKNHKLSHWTMILISVAYSAYPPITQACTYDIHENCFLLPLLLWMIYFYEKDKKILLLVFALLVLTVKEDAFVYVAIFALYVMFAHRDFKKGGLLLLISFVWFALASYYINHHGMGIMSSRFSNLSKDDEGLFGVVKTLMLNPGLVIKQIFFVAEKDNADKVIYFIQLFLPLAFIPFMNRKAHRFLLVAPVLINLLTQYVYQYGISKQYHFGITAFLFYVAVLNLADRKPRRQKFLAMTSAVVAVIFAFSALLPSLEHYANKYKLDRSEINAITTAIECIPDDASVTATAFMVVPLSMRNEVYELEYHEAINTDYLVLDLRSSDNEIINSAGEKYMKAGYKLVTKTDNAIAIYKR